MSKNASTYIDENDFYRLQEIANRLHRKYPNDSLSNFWNGPNKIVFIGALLIGVAITFTSAPIWMAFIPFISVSIIFDVIPALFLKRKKYAPRWAHPKTVLTNEDVQDISAIVEKLRPVQRTFLSKQLPSDTGDKFWIIWSSASEYMQGEAHVALEYQIGSKEIAIHLVMLLINIISCFMILQIFGALFGFDFSQWLLSHIDSEYTVFRSFFKFFTIPIIKM